MAPNRKSISALVQTLSCTDLESLQQSVVPSKYAPLTSESETSTPPPITTSSPQQEDSCSYWDWPAEEEKDLFSVAHIEANLVQSSNTLSSPTKTDAVNDSYWAEADQQSEPAVTPVTNEPQHMESNYWQWSADQDAKKTVLENILAEEQAYALVSGAMAQVVEQTASSPRNVVINGAKQSNDTYWQWNSAHVAREDPHASANYWDWDGKEQVVNPLQAILEYEAVRQLLKAETVVQQLKANAKELGPSQTNASSDDYWNSSESYGDDYWEAQTSRPITTGYWDWDC